MIIPGLLSIIGCLLIRMNRINNEKRIYYHNYMSCLKALAEFDEGLAEFLEHRLGR